jgi:hypothetical protein
MTHALASAPDHASCDEYRALSEQMAARIAEIANIPEGTHQRSRLRERLVSCVATIWWVHNLDREDSNRSSERHLSARAMRTARRRLSKAAAVYLAEIAREACEMQRWNQRTNGLGGPYQLAPLLPPEHEVALLRMPCGDYRIPDRKWVHEWLTRVAPQKIDRLEEEATAHRALRRLAGLEVAPDELDCDFVSIEPVYLHGSELLSYDDLLKLRGVPLKTRRGRPAGSTTHCDLRAIIEELLSAVAEAGGRLRFDKNYPDRGTLTLALRALTPYLPAGVIPRKLPVRCLSETYAEWRKNNRNKNS